MIHHARLLYRRWRFILRATATSSRFMHAACGTLAALGAELALASLLTVHVGPPSLGNGGSNPVSIPPLNPIEYEVTWVSEQNFESNIAITPGLLFGKRSELVHGMYVGLGGGLVLNANGGGPGVYSSLGWNTGSDIMFNAEVKQALGVSFDGGTLLSPYAIRLGVTFKM